MVGLPVPEISAESMALGENWRNTRAETAAASAPKQAPTKKATTTTPKKTPKKRGKVLDPDPVKEMSINIGHNECKKLVDGGFLKVRRVPGPFPVNPSDVVANNALPVPEEFNAPAPENPASFPQSVSSRAFSVKFNSDYTGETREL